MGIPGLFAHLIERYPNLSQTITANQVKMKTILIFEMKICQKNGKFQEILISFQLPNYDYFYIDVNVLLHKASHPLNRLPRENVDEQFFHESRIFERVLHWIETLYRLIRPSKVLFLGIDGVAPCECILMM